MRFFFDESGRWSGGGRALIENARFAADRHSILRGSPDRDVPIIARNVPRVRPRRPYVLAPQNAWPFHPCWSGVAEGARWFGLRAGTRVYARSAAAVLRISEAIEVSSSLRVSPVIHNVLDTQFDEAWARSAGDPAEWAAGAVVCIGSIVSYRNVANLVAGHRHYVELGGCAPLVIAGPGDGQVARRLAKLTAGRPDVFLRIGQLSRAQCLAASRVAAVVVLPSVVEASPLSALEAVASNRHVAMSDILGHTGVLRRFGGLAGHALFDPADVAAIGRALWATERAESSGDMTTALASPETREMARIRWSEEVVSWLEILG